MEPRAPGSIKTFILVALLPAATAFAADSPGAATTDPLDEIIVTANKRSEDVRNVPTSISVLGGQKLEEQHINSFDDISRSVPGVSFGSGVGVGFENLEIRGISSVVGAATVGLYIDDTSITLANESGTILPQILDLDRIEVLRGPQGTLYGASSEGGTIRFITRKPDPHKFSADVSTDLSGTHHGSLNYDEKASVNIPIVDGVFAIRAAAQFGHQSGWIDNYAHATGALLASDPVTALLTSSGTLVRSGVNDVDSSALKLAAVYLSSDHDLTITPSIYYQKQTQDDAPNFFPGEGLYNQTKTTAEFGRDTTVLPTLSVEKGLGFARLTSVSSYLWRQNHSNRDGTFYDPDVVVPYFLDPTSTPTQAVAANTLLATLPTTADTKITDRVVSQELRLTSEPQPVAGSSVKWVAGLYFSRDAEVLNHFEHAAGWNQIFESIYGYSPDSPLSPISDPAIPAVWSGDQFLTENTKRKTTQYAAFTQLDVDILSNLHAIAGLRYQYDELTFEREQSGFWSIGSPASFASASHDDAATPKFSLMYDLSSRANVYATAAKGYRVGGPNDIIPLAACPSSGGLSAEPVTYAPDSLWSYELGSKSQLFDNALSINADVYDIQWKNVQQQITLPICGYTYVSNVGDAEAYGFEAEVRYRVPIVPGLMLGFSGNAQHAVITSTTNPATAANGEALLFTPEWTAVLSVDYSWRVGDAMKAFVHADGDWTGQSHGDFNTSAPDFLDKGYNVINANVGVDTDYFTVSLYAKNLANNHSIIKHPEIALVVEDYTVQPLTVGVRLSKHF